MRRTNNQVRTVLKPFKAEAARAAAQQTKLDIAQGKSKGTRKCWAEKKEEEEEDMRRVSEPQFATF